MFTGGEFGELVGELRFFCLLTLLLEGDGWEAVVTLAVCWLLEPDFPGFVDFWLLICGLDCWLTEAVVAGQALTSISNSQYLVLISLIIVVRWHLPSMVSTLRTPSLTSLRNNFCLM